MSSPGHSSHAGTHSSRHLSPNASSTTFESLANRGRSSSTGLGSGRKGYNASPSHRSTSASPSPPLHPSHGSHSRNSSSNNHNATSSHRAMLSESSRRSRSSSGGLTGRKGYNAEAGLEGRKGYNADGVEGRKGYNNDSSAPSSREASRSRSREPRHQGLGSKSFFTSPLNPSHDTPMERQRSGDGVNGRKGYNNYERSGSISAQGSIDRRASPRPDTRDGLTGRKGYNSSPQPSPLLPGAGSGSSSPRHDGLGGRKGYNGSPQPPSSTSSSPRPDGREGLGGRKGYNGSPQPDHSERRGSHVEEHHHSEEKERKNSVQGLGIAMGAGRTYGGLGGRKGYNAPRGVSPGH